MRLLVWLVLFVVVLYFAYLGEDDGGGTAGLVASGVGALAALAIVGVGLRRIWSGRQNEALLLLVVVWLLAGTLFAVGAVQWMTPDRTGVFVSLGKFAAPLLVAGIFLLAALAADRDSLLPMNAILVALLGIATVFLFGLGFLLLAISLVMYGGGLVRTGLVEFPFAALAIAAPIAAMTGLDGREGAAGELGAAAVLLVGVGLARGARPTRVRRRAASRTAPRPRTARSGRG